MEADKEPPHGTLPWQAAFHRRLLHRFARRRAPRSQSAAQVDRRRADVHPLSTARGKPNSRSPGASFATNARGASACTIAPGPASRPSSARSIRATASTGKRPELGLVEFDGSTRNNITNARAQHLSLIRDPYEQNETHRWKQIDNQPTRVDESGAPRTQAHFSQDGYNWHRYPVDRHSRQKMLFNFGSPARDLRRRDRPGRALPPLLQHGSNRRTRGPGTTRQPGLPQLVRPAPASSPPTVFARNKAARYGSMSMPVPVNCVMKCWRIQAGRFPGCSAADCDPIRADTLRWPALLER